MTNEEYESRLCEICSKIDTLPEGRRGRLLEVVEETRRRHADIRVSIRRASGALDDWRLQAKYRLFDMEAADREARAELKNERNDGE